MMFCTLGLKSYLVLMNLETESIGLKDIYTQELDKLSILPTLKMLRDSFQVLNKLN